MPDPAPRLPCPVCLGTTMDRVAFGPGGALQIDHCRRCGGVWLEHGEVQALRALPARAFWTHVAARSYRFRMRCHDCHAPLERAEERCRACGWENVLDCPGCERPMRVESRAGLRLDVCHDCKGVWFDHHELKAIWGASFDRVMQKRQLTRQNLVASSADGTAGGLLDAVIYAPDLTYLGARAVGHGVSASVEALSQLPGAVAAAPDVASGVFDAVGEAAGVVFETVLEIVAGIFSGI
jgi:Zn-finger nucleic acid-binding protein